MGATVTIGRAVGAKKLDDAAAAIGTPQEAIAGTGWYLTICFLGIPFVTAYNIISSVFRGLGDSKSPMYFITVACAANIVLDYLFIGGFGFCAAGAALGTTLAQSRYSDGLRHIGFIHNILAIVLVRVPGGVPVDEEARIVAKRRVAVQSGVENKFFKNMVDK